MNTIVTTYLHSDEDANLDRFSDLGFTGTALDFLRHALYEVEFKLEVTPAGRYRIIEVDQVPCEGRWS